jgi:hypothetical protein
MEELQTMRLSDKSFEAKFTVLAENVKHHIDEEEGEMFPKAAEAGRQKLMDIGNKLQERKMELKEEWERPRKRAASSSSRNGRSSAGRTRSEAQPFRDTQPRDRRHAEGREQERHALGGVTSTGRRTVAGAERVEEAHHHRHEAAFNEHAQPPVVELRSPTPGGAADAAPSCCPSSRASPAATRTRWRRIRTD